MLQVFSLLKNNSINLNKNSPTAKVKHASIYIMTTKVHPSRLVEGDTLICKQQSLIPVSRADLLQIHEKVYCKRDNTMT